MKLDAQKRIAAVILNCSKKRVVFDPSRLEDIKEAITKVDIRILVSDGAIKRKPVRGISRFRARKRIVQRRKGRQKGFGSRKGKKTARLPRKKLWMNRIKAQRKLLKELRNKNVITKRTYRELYMKTKGGFFRSRGHIDLYIKEHNLAKK